MKPVHVHVMCQGDVNFNYLASNGETLSASLESIADPIAQAPTRVGSIFPPLSVVRPGRFLKLDANGDLLPPDATDHAIVRDLGTGLDWLVAYATEEAVPHADAVTAAAAVRVAGHEDWRLPERFELESILDLGRHNPAIDPLFFPGTKSAYHWTASPDASDPDYAWYVDFDYGLAGLYDRSLLAFARAVRVASARQ